MKNSLRRLLTVYLVCAMALSLCACTSTKVSEGGSTPETSDLTIVQTDRPRETTAPVEETTEFATESIFEGMMDLNSEHRNAEAAKECMLNILLANDEESVKAFLTADSYESAGDFVSYYLGANYEVTTEKVGIHQGYELFYYTIMDTVSGASEWGISIFVKEGDGYKLCLNSDVIRAAGLLNI